MKRICLIVNADDFGLAPEVNEAVARAYDGGLVRSASLLAGGEHAVDAAAIAIARPDLGVGVHLALTQVKPVLAPDRIPSLIGTDGLFLPGPRQIVVRLASGRLSLSEVRAEWTAQIERALDLGVRVTHLDGHQHLHVLPGVCQVFREVADKFGVRAMRLPRLGGPIRSPGEWVKGLAIHGAQLFARAALRGMLWPDRFWGLACSGEMTRERLGSVLESLTPGTHELMVHPAADRGSMSITYDWNYRWAAELSAICDPDLQVLAQDREIVLGSFRDLARW